MKNITKPYIIALVIIISSIVLVSVKWIPIYLEKKNIEHSYNEWKTKKDACVQENGLDWKMEKANFQSKYAIPQAAIGGQPIISYSEKYKQCFVNIQYIYSLGDGQLNKKTTIYKWFIVLTKTKDVIYQIEANKKNEVSKRLELDKLLNMIESGDNKMLQKAKALDEERKRALRHVPMGLLK